MVSGGEFLERGAGPVIGEEEIFGALNQVPTIDCFSVTQIGEEKGS